MMKFPTYLPKDHRFKRLNFFSWVCAARACARQTDTIPYKGSFLARARAARTHDKKIKSIDLDLG